MPITTFIIAVLMAATLGILIAGLIAMVKGDKANQSLSNKFMRMRIIFQALAITAICLAAYLSS